MPCSFQESYSLKSLHEWLKYSELSITIYRTIEVVRLNRFHWYVISTGYSFYFRIKQLALIKTQFAGNLLVQTFLH